MGCITDVPGVRVAHVTLGGQTGDTLDTRDTVHTGAAVRTGVTCVLPGTRDLLRSPVPAAVHVVNGYGKPVGLAQVMELGEVETPVVLTSTLSVGAAHEGVVRHLLGRHPGLGRPDSVNPVVLECNDGRLSDLRALAVRPEHVMEAIARAEASPAGQPAPEGAVGAGHGMVAFGWKGGVGTASVPVDDGVWRRTLGALVLTNMGRAEDLLIDGRHPAPAPAPAPTTLSGDHHPTPLQDTVAGSVVVVLASDAPLDARQLGRLARRAQNGLARTGVPTDHGSGEFVLAFSTAAAPETRRDDRWLRPWFRAVADVVEDAVRSSLVAAVTTTGRDGVTAYRCPWV